jgi:peptidoglycan-associated lipoprotein
MFKANGVLFDYDRATIKTSEMAKIAAVAESMKVNARDALLIEGHCDERGTDGYNLALGERRALAVREVLLNLGVANERLRTISYGESQPMDPGHDETAWALNRRAAFVLLRPPGAQ